MDISFHFWTSMSKNLFWNSPTSLHHIKILSISLILYESPSLFPEKLCSVTASLSSFLLSVSSTLHWCVYYPILPFFGWWSTYAFTFWVTWSHNNLKLEPLTLFAQRGYPYRYSLERICMPSIPLANLGGQAYNFSSCIGNIPDRKEISHFYFSLTYFRLSCMLSLHQLGSPKDMLNLGKHRVEASRLLFVRTQWRPLWLWFQTFVPSTYSSICSITGVLNDLQSYIHS